jgi:cation-transporting ATPase E
MMAFAVPAAILNLVFGIILFAAYYYAALNELITYSFSPEQLANFEALVGFELQGEGEAAVVAAGYVARSALTAFLIGTGILLILFVEPPFRFFSIEEKVVGDWKTVVLAVAMAVCLVGVLLIEPLHKFFEIVVLRPVDYAILAALVLIWMFLFRTLRRRHAMERFLASS